MNAIFALPLAVLLLTVPIGASSGRQAVEHEPPKDGVSFDFTPRPDAHQRPYIISVSVDGFTRYFEFPADHPDDESLDCAAITLRLQRRCGGRGAGEMREPG